jgi:NadR type nicotinamide-nucleotide adenylyltransferase
MANVMDIKFIPVDVKRELVSISGTMMRKNPLAHWEYLHPVVRPYFLKRVAIVGPESSGKSTLSVNLADHFDTVSVAEYARNMFTDFSINMLEYDASKPTIKDMSTIARGQIASEDSLARQANRVIFCDTELLTAKYWSGFYFKECPVWIEKAAQARKYDLYMLLDPRGVEAFYTDDTEHSMPKLEDRIAMFYWWQAELNKRKLPFVVIDGSDWETRQQKAITVINQTILTEAD